MDLLILFVGVAGSALCDFLAAALRNLPAGVVTTMADEGSPAGKLEGRRCHQGARQQPA